MRCHFSFFALEVSAHGAGFDPQASYFLHIVVSALRTVESTLLTAPLSVNILSVQHVLENAALGIRV